jgi:hypothetical protein
MAIHKQVVVQKPAEVDKIVHALYNIKTFTKPWINRCNKGPKLQISIEPASTHALCKSWSFINMYMELIVDTNFIKTKE